MVHILKGEEEVEVGNAGKIRHHGNDAILRSNVFRSSVVCNLRFSVVIFERGHGHGCLFCMPACLSFFLVGGKEVLDIIISCNER